MFAVSACSGQKVPTATSAADADRWTVFRTWTKTELPRLAVAFEDNSRAATTAAVTGDRSGMGDAGRRLEGTARVMKAYLADHPPAACYADIHTHLADFLAAAERAGADIGGGAAKEGVAEMKSGRAQIAILRQAIRPTRSRERQNPAPRGVRSVAPTT